VTTPLLVTELLAEASVTFQSTVRMLWLPASVGSPSLGVKLYLIESSAA